MLSLPKFLELLPDLEVDSLGTLLLGGFGIRSWSMKTQIYFAHPESTDRRKKSRNDQFHELSKIKEFTKEAQSARTLNSPIEEDNKNL